MFRARRGRPAAKRQRYRAQNWIAVALPLSSIWNHVLGDHAVTFQVPSDRPMQTQVRTKWLVHKDAVEGKDYSIEDLSHVWLATNSQDQRVVEENQLGIRSPAYEPGPYAPDHEDGVAQSSTGTAEQCSAGSGAPKPASAASLRRFRLVSGIRRQGLESGDESGWIAGNGDLLEPALCAGDDPRARGRDVKHASPTGRTKLDWLPRPAERCARAPRARTIRHQAEPRRQSRRARPSGVRRQETTTPSFVPAPGFVPGGHPSSSSFMGCRSRTIALARSSSTWV